MFGEKIAHGTPFRRAVEEGLLDPKRVIQIGIRGSLYMGDMWKFSYDSGMRVMLIEEVEERGWRACIDEARDIVGDDPIYVSFDIDSLDPAFAPGVSHHEPGGLSTREVIGIIQGLKGRIVGADIVELNPRRDPSGITAMAAAKPPASLEEIMKGISESRIKEVKVLPKADVQGSLEAVTGSLRNLDRDEVELSFVHRAVGGITENDITLAATTNSSMCKPTKATTSCGIERAGAAPNTDRI